MPSVTSEIASAVALYSLEVVSATFWPLTELLLPSRETAITASSTAATASAPLATRHAVRLDQKRARVAGAAGATTGLLLRDLEQAGAQGSRGLGRRPGGAQQLLDAIERRVVVRIVDAHLIPVLVKVIRTRGPCGFQQLFSHTD